MLLTFAIFLSVAAPLNASITPKHITRKSVYLEPNTTAVDLQRQLDRLKQALLSRSVSINLQQAVEQSLANNPTLAEQYSQIQNEQWNLIAVRRSWYPQLLVTGPTGNIMSYQSGSNKASAYTSKILEPKSRKLDFKNTINTAPNPMINLNWTFFDPKRGPSINASSENLRAQQLLFDVAARDLVLETQLAYFALQEKQELIKNYEQILNSITKAVNQTEALFIAGNLSITDVEQIRTQQFQQLTLLIETYRQLVSAAAKLSEAMALPVGSLVTTQGNLALIGKWSLSEAETLQRAEQFREEIQASLATASSFGWQATVLSNSYWPSFSTYANGSFSHTDIAEGIPGSERIKNTQLDQWSGAVGIGFSWSIFDGGIKAAEAQAKQAQKNQFTDKAARQRLSVAREVVSAYANYQGSELGLVSAKQQIQSAQKASEAVSERFKVGYSDITAVVQTYRQYQQAAAAFSSAIREFNNSVVSLYRYSASWPDGALPLLQKRVQNLK
ncbi:TolC family protein [Synechococcus lacustris L1E-Slac]|nr:TolC family protein [Synechococcus lacustris L1E-Slac]